MTGGINRFEKEASLVQTVDALDVVEENGDLRRRPAFKSIATGPYHDKFRGDIKVLNMWWSGSAPTGPGDFTADAMSSYGYGSCSKARIGGDLTASAGGVLLVGMNSETANLPDALRLINVLQDENVIAGTTGAQTRYLLPQLITGTDLSDEDNYYTLPWWLDTTRWTSEDTDAAEYKRAPLSKDGLISWHKGDFTETWSRVSLNGDSLYWIALNMTAQQWEFNDPDSTPTKVMWDSTGTLTIQEPGFQFVSLEKIEGIFQTPKGKMIFCSGRDKIYGQERGGAVASWDGNLKEAVEMEHFIQDEGQGVLGQQTLPAWTNGAASTTKGTADQLTKGDESYSWYQDQFSSNIIDTIDSTNFVGTSNLYDQEIWFQPTNGEFRDRELCGCIIECTAGGNSGELALIIASAEYTGFGSSPNDQIISYRPAFTNDPVGTDTYKIYQPPSKVTSLDKSSVISSANRTTILANLKAAVWERYPEFEIVGTVGNHTATLVDGAHDLIPFNSDLSDFPRLDGAPVHWQIVKPLTYLVNPGRWSAFFDPMTREFIMCNGHSGLLRWNGSNFRKVTASYLTTGNRGAAVQKWTGILNDALFGAPAGEQGAGLLPQSFLRTEPPFGKYITDFAGRTVVCGISSEPREVKYSAPGAFNDIWPLIYSIPIRDAGGGSITGMAKLGDRLVVFTPKSVHATEAPGEDGYFRFRLISEGMGFISNESVKEVPVGSTSALIGANSDGLYLLQGESLTPVIDDWRRILPQGVNASRMNQSCAGVSLFNNLYYLAVPSAGSNVNDRLLVVDFSAGAPRVWVWTTPFGGISFIGRQLDDNGNERVLFGHEDGHISILAEQERDDGNVITGRAKSPPIQFGGTTNALIGIAITGKELGTTDTVTCNFYKEQRQAAFQSPTITFDEGVPLLDTVTLGSTVAEHPAYPTESVRIKAGTRVNIFQYEISGTQQWRIRQCVLRAKPLSQRSKI